MNIKENIIEVRDLKVKVIRKDIQNLHLAVYPPDGWVRISVPNIVDDDAVRLAVISKLGWIKRQQDLFNGQPRQDARELITRESHYFLGKRYLLDVEPCEDSKETVYIKNKTTICMRLKNTASLSEKQVLLNKWYRKELRKLLPDLVKKWEEKTGFQADMYGIKRMKTKWGSCNPATKRIWLNLELAKKPQNCIEYILLHELVHFWERNHNDAFVAHMDRLMPQWRSYRDELNALPLAYEHWTY